MCNSSIISSLPQRTVVIAFALLVAAVVLLAAFGGERGGGLDELALFNPSYMLARHGELTYPVYTGYFDKPVLIHPPLHVGLIGLLMRAGASWYYAEALPTAVLFLLAIAAIVRARWPAAVQLGLLYSIAFVVLLPTVVLFGTRPEGAVHAAWLLGAVLLESGRLEKWRPWLLAGGAFVLVWGCATHYYATPGLLGAAVYAGWVVRERGWRGARIPLIAIAGGGCLAGVPYLVFYIVPYWRDILEAIRSAEGGVGFSEAVRWQSELYRQWSHRAGVPWMLAMPLRAGIPLMFAIVPLLWWLRPLRALAIACVPLLAFITFGAAHKQYSYLVHEWGLWAAAVTACALTLAESKLKRHLALPGALLLSVSLVASAAGRLQAPRYRVHEADLARAATRDIVGANARVAARIGAWYTSGAAALLSFDYLSVAPDPFSTLLRIDAAAEHPHMSDFLAPGKQENLATWYADGRLSLRGFYFGESDAEMKIVLLSTRTLKVHGYAFTREGLQRFDEDAAGDHEVTAALCPESPVLSLDNWAAWGTASSLRLPKGGAVLTRLAKRGKANLPQGCRVLRVVDGRVSVADSAALLRAPDPPIHFCRTPDEVRCALAESLLPPQGASPVPGVLQLARSPQLISTPSEKGVFAPALPMITQSVAGKSGWVHLRLRVTAGTIRLATVRDGRMEVQAPTPIGASAVPQDVAFPVPSFASGQQLVFVNESSDGPSAAELYTAGVLIR